MSSSEPFSTSDVSTSDVIEELPADESVEAVAELEEEAEVLDEDPAPGPSPKSAAPPPRRADGRRPPGASVPPSPKSAAPKVNLRGATSSIAPRPASVAPGKLSGAATAPRPKRTGLADTPSVPPVAKRDSSAVPPLPPRKDRESVAPESNTPPPLPVRSGPPPAPRPGGSVPPPPTRAGASVTPAPPASRVPPVPPAPSRKPPAPRRAEGNEPARSVPAVAEMVDAPVSREPPPLPTEAAELPGFGGLARWAAPQTAEDAFEIVPTYYDASAGERHASPWTDERRQVVLRENALKLVELFESQLAKPGERQRKPRIHYEAARLYESPLRDLEASARHYEQAAKLARTHAPSVRGARRVMLSLKKHKAALRLFDAEMELTPDPAQRAMLLYEKAQLLAGPLAQANEAREVLRQALELAPTNLTIIKANALCEEQAAAWEEFVRAMEKGSSAEQRYPQERAAYLAQAARATSVHLKAPERAIELYKAALEADPHAPGVIESLKELLYSRKRWSELVTVLAREAELAEAPASRAFALYRAGRILVERLADVDGAISAFEQAAAVAPSDRVVLDELSRLYELTRRYEQVVRVSEHLLTLETRPNVEVLCRLGQVYEQKLNQPQLAIERYQAALAIDAGFRPVLLALGRLREKRGEWPELVEMLSHEAESSENAEHRAALHARIADICETKLNSEPYAVEHHKRALGLRPGYEPSYKALVRLHSTAGRWFELIELYERGLEVATSKSERIATLFSIGRLQEDALGRPGVAQAAYQRILELDAGCMEAIAALQRAAERALDYRALVSALELEVARGGDHKPRNLALKHRAGVILAERLGDVEAAIERFNDVLAHDATYMPAIESLLELYQRDGRYQELLKVYEKELVITRAPEQRAVLLGKMAELCVNELAQLEQGAVYFRRALQSDERHLPSIRGLRQVLTRTGDHAEVARLFGVEAELVESIDVGQATRLLFLQGEVHENRLDAQDKALACYRKALTLDPGFRAAADGCTRLLEQARDYRQLDELLGGQLRQQAEPRVAFSLAYRRAEVQRDQLKQPTEAAATLESALTQHGGHLGTLLALERLYSLADDRDALKRTLSHEAQLSEAPGGAVAAYRALLGLLARAGDVEPTQAKQLQQAILRIVPTDVEALFGLERAALLDGDSALLSQIDAKLGVAGIDRASTAAYQTRLGEAMEASGDNSALEVYRAALAHDPENLAAARGVSRIAERLQSPQLLQEAAEAEASLLERPDDAARLLVLAASRLIAAGDVSGSVRRLTRALELYPDHARAGEALSALIARGVSPDQVIEVLSQAAAHAAARERRAALWVNIAHLQHQHRRDVGAAVAAAQRAIREQASSVEAHVLLAQLYAVSRRWKECVETLLELMKLNPAAEVRFETLLQLATVQHDHLKATALAASNVAAALGLQPDSRTGLALLLRIQLSRDDLRKAAETAQRLVEVSVTREEKAEALFHSAKLERHRGDQARAVDAYRGAIAILGMSGDAANEFREYLVTLGDTKAWQAYADGLSVYLGSQQLRSEERGAVHAEVGRTLYDKIGNRDGGLVELAKALSLQSSHTKLRAELAERCERAARYDQAAREYQQLIAEAPQMRGYWRSIANCYTGMGKTEQASIALAPLVVAREATADEIRRYQQTPRSPGELTANPLPAEELRRFEEGSPVAGVVVDLLSALSVVLPKIFPVPFESYGVTVRDKISARAPNSIRDLADRIAVAFGAPEFELYVHSLGRPLVSVEYSELPALFVHSDVALRPRAEQVLLLGRALFNISRGTQLVDMLSATDLEILLVAAVRNYEPTFGTELASAETLEAQARRVSKAMPWFKGNRVEPAARSYAASGIQLQRWILGAHLSAVRAAAMAADDLASSLTLLGAGIDDRFVERVTSFLVTEPAQALKRRLLA